MSPRGFMFLGVSLRACARAYKMPPASPDHLPPLLSSRHIGDSPRYC